MHAGATLGRYKLIERLASGGMAEVYLAEQEGDTGITRRVAIKTILPQFTEEPSMRTMMLDEARMGFLLRHRNIVQVIDVGRSSDRLYIAMEFVSGVNLAQLGDGLKHELVAYIGCELLAGLGYAHDRAEEGEALGIVHRDVSPQNVLISEAGEVKLTDFGIALARDRLTRTNTGAIKGKLAYIAPEQAANETLDRRADIFSAGAVLYRLLCGRPPFAGDSELEVFQSIQDGRITPLCELRGDLSPEFRGVVEKALCIAREGRYASANEFRLALEPFALRSAAAEETLRVLVGQAQARQKEIRAKNRAFEQALWSEDETFIAQRSAQTMTSVADDSGSTAVWPWKLWGGVAAAIVVTGIGLWVGPLSSSNEAGAQRSEDANSTTIATAAGRDASAATAVTDAGIAVQVPETGGPNDSLPIDAGLAKKAPRKRPVSRYGRATITAFPWAQVKIDGKFIGSTPIRSYKLKVGVHKVRLTNPQTGKSVNRRIQVKPGKVTRLKVKL